MLVNPEILNYIEVEIIPRYDSFDKAHRRDHVRMVIDQSLKLAEHMHDINIDMVYCIAAYHDLGLVNGRENHHIDSGRILRSDPFISKHFSPEQIDIMCEAVEDHRASGKTAPRSDYGKIVADADRFIDPETIIRRTVQYGLANYPHLDRDGQYIRTAGHLAEKYGPQGYLRIWLPWSGNITRLQHLHAIIADPVCLREIFDSIYDGETNNMLSGDREQTQQQ